MASDLFQFILGLAVLYVGAELLVKGAVRLAQSFGVSPLLIGLTIVAFGTSTPELALDLTAAYKGAVDLAYGDLVGSNAANIGLVLGAAATIRSLAVPMGAIRIEVLIALASALVLWVLSLDGEISRIDGAILLIGFAVFIFYAYRQIRSEVRIAATEKSNSGSRSKRDRLVDLAMIVGGLLALIGGAQLMVGAAVRFAQAYGVSELVIGLTIVAIGTSLPELATNVVAAIRNHAEIAVGNIVGSNIFNVLFVMGAVAQVRPLPVRGQSLSFDLPYMVGLTLALGLIMWRGSRVSRGEGMLLLAAYAVFIFRQFWGG